MVSTPECAMEKENPITEYGTFASFRSGRDNSPSCLISPLSNGSSEEGMGWGFTCCHHEYRLLWSTHSTQLVSILFIFFVILEMRFVVISRIVFFEWNVYHSRCSESSISSDTRASIGLISLRDHDSDGHLSDARWDQEGIKSFRSGLILRYSCYIRPTSKQTCIDSFRWLLVIEGVSMIDENTEPLFSSLHIVRSGHIQRTQLASLPMNSPIVINSLRFTSFFLLLTLQSPSFCTDCCALSLIYLFKNALIIFISHSLGRFFPYVTRSCHPKVLISSNLSCYWTSFCGVCPERRPLNECKSGAGLRS